MHDTAIRRFESFADVMPRLAEQRELASLNMHLWSWRRGAKRALGGNRRVCILFGGCARWGPFAEGGTRFEQSTRLCNLGSSVRVGKWSCTADQLDLLFVEVDVQNK